MHLLVVWWFGGGGGGGVIYIVRTEFVSSDSRSNRSHGMNVIYTNEWHHHHCLPPTGPPFASKGLPKYPIV